MLQRDCVIEHITEHLLNNKKFNFISADFGAKALDRLREEYPQNFHFVGIAEQFAIDFAYGLSSSSLNPIVYGMSPFITLRCIEQVKVLFGQSKFPLLLMSVGGGLGYDHSTLSHFSLEDISLLGSIPGFKVLTPADCKRSENFVKKWLKSPNQIYLRLERQSLPFDISESYDTQNEYLVHNIKNREKIAIFSSPYLAYEYEKLNHEDSIIIIESTMPLPNNILELITKAKTVKLFEEAYEFTGIYPWITKNISFKNLEHHFIGEEIADDRLKRKSIWEKYNLI
ncbi:MAG: hypothetical protein CBD58_01120 [bacterium TMED198]|nr:MAG: hypothetical protein CBD58_01120 [bacterium TMED198]